MKIFAKINLDGTGARSFSTGLPFLEHMLDQVARHGLIDSSGSNPGGGRVRISLVANIDDCVTAAGRIADFIQGIHSQGRPS